MLLSLNIRKAVLVCYIILECNTSFNISKQKDFHKVFFISFLDGVMLVNTDLIEKNSMGGNDTRNRRK